MDVVDGLDALSSGCLEIILQWVVVPLATGPHAGNEVGAISLTYLWWQTQELFAADPGRFFTLFRIQGQSVSRPKLRGRDNASARVMVLTPKFEGVRAKSLSIPSDVEWVDVCGREYPSFPKATVIAVPTEIRQLRERKSEGEPELLKCANKQMHIGIRKSDARQLIARALADAGLKDGGCLTLFGENIALPHGSGTDRRLGPDDFALFDCTASLHGYWSDVTRTLALPASTIPKTHTQIWNFVHSTQNIAFQTAHAGVVTKRVDEAPRLFLGLAGYAKYSSHRLGHGIGLEAHEDPYLNGRSKIILQTRHTFSDEPGVYIEGKVDVRLEDCFYIAQNGSVVYLMAGVRGPASSPWKP
ncbi:peptidase M24, structural domain-containing protein [Armillaria borealis]|uniref:Peptidase M24, structural domain-containing protein n=1 Tax=Armillaria borealis TaxID=47425 RepID=A0AA39IU76_9AGAR|nr:peptidase M24, structural domain-containing protein [Armillaria borealis]